MPEKDDWGEEMYNLVSRLYPIPRSLTGQGVRSTLRILQNEIPLEIREVPTGTHVFDWTVPREWNVREAYIRNQRGEKVIDFADSPLHVVGYSVPVKARLSLEQLKEHLHTLPEHPDWIPYRTSYYQEDWGFCLSYRQLLNLEKGEYEVVIDASLEDGHLTYGECFLPGMESEEILVHSHICHPALCNDNLSGISVAWALCRLLCGRPRRYSYRFLFLPGTIGAITWLALNEEQVYRIRGGLVLACAGDSGNPTYKKSRQGDSEIDRAVLHVLRHSGQPYEVQEFSPWGYDERQYCSPAFNLPVGVLMRTPHGQFPEYHTSADNLELVGPEFLADTLTKLLQIVEVVENNRRYKSLSKCEPQLGKRGLYRSAGGGTARSSDLALLWVLNLSDGQHSLLDIAQRAGLVFHQVKAAADALAECGLVEEVEN